MTEATNDVQTDGSTAEPEILPTEKKSAKEELNEILSLIRAHLAFQADTMRFTRQSLAAIRETLAGIDPE